MPQSQKERRNLVRKNIRKGRGYMAIPSWEEMACWLSSKQKSSNTTTKTLQGHAVGEARTGVARAPFAVSWSKCSGEKKKQKWIRREHSRKRRRKSVITQRIVYRQNYQKKKLQKRPNLSQSHFFFPHRSVQCLYCNQPHLRRLVN